MDLHGGVAPPVARQGDVDLALLGRPQLPDVGGRAVAESSAVAREQQGGTVAAIARELPMADRVDAPVDDVQAPGAHAALDRLAAQPELQQLRAIHDAFLARGDCGERGIALVRSTFGSNSDLSVDLAGHAASMRPRALRDQAVVLQRQPAFVTLPVLRTAVSRRFRRHRC